MFGKAAPGTPPTGIQMMLRSLGFDPQEFQHNIESAKDVALKVIKNFDERLTTLESRMTGIETQLTETHQVLCRIVSSLEILSKQNTTSDAIKDFSPLTMTELDRARS